MIPKIFPFTAENDLYNSFKLILVSEGYTSAQQPDFLAACHTFVEELLLCAPFSFTRMNPSWLSVYAAFEPSDVSGVTLDGAGLYNRTAFDGSVDTGTDKLTISENAIVNWVNTAEISFRDTSVPLIDLLKKGQIPKGSKASLLVFLAPSLGAHPNGGDGEHIPSSADYYYVASTLDGHWHQVIIRAICKSMGLADEFELDGPDYLEPTTDEEKKMPFNLEYHATPPTSPEQATSWLPLFSATQRAGSLTVNTKPSTTSADNSITAGNQSYSKIIYWEGGGRFRSKVYRSAEDCLQRRRIGSSTLPVRTHRLALCPACTSYVKRIIL